MSDSKRAEEITATAVALGLAQQTRSITDVLAVGKKLGNVVEGLEISLVLPALLITYYLCHFPADQADMEKPEFVSEILKKLVWFAEEGSLSLGMLLSAAVEIEDGTATKH